MKKKLFYYCMVLLIFFAACEKTKDKNESGEIRFLNQNLKKIYGKGYSNGFGPGNLGSKVKGIVYKIEIINHSLDNKQVNFNYGDSIDKENVFSRKILPYETYSRNIIVRINNLKETNRLFIDELSDISNLEISFQPIYNISGVDGVEEINNINADITSIIEKEYANGVGPGNIGTNIKGIIYKVEILNNSDVYKQVYFNYGNAAQEENSLSFKIQPREKFSQIVLIRVSTPNENDRIFVDSKSDISNLNVYVTPLFYINKSDINEEIKILNSQPASIAATGYTNGGAAGYTDSDIKGVIYRIETINNSSDYKQVNFIFGTASEEKDHFGLTIQPKEIYVQYILFRVIKASVDDRLFVNPNTDISNVSINVKPVSYIKSE